MKPEIEDPRRLELSRKIQQNFPVCSEPYHMLAREVGLTPAEVMQQIADWKNDGLLREVSAVMEGAAIGHDSALVCGKVPEERLDEVAAIISNHPTVTHNYERNHEWNIWFTIAVPRTQGLENHLAALSQLTGIEPFYALRRTLTFKVGVVFDFKKATNQTVRVDLPEKIPHVILADKDIKILRALQKDLPVSEHPFADLAFEQGLTEADLIGFVRRERGRVLRRYIGTFRHRRMGISANGMTVWNVPVEDLPIIGPRLAANGEVSHCYARNNFPGFPYTLYSMLHAGSRDALHAMAERVSKEIDIDEYLILESPREFKKTRLRYYLPETEAWWQHHGHLAEGAEFATLTGGARSATA